MTIQEKISALRAINLEILFDQTIRDNEKDILDLNREQMYEEGTMDITKPGKIERYSPLTIKAKKRAPFNRTDHITLKWMGAFHASLKILIFKAKLVISSDNSIWDKYLEPQGRFSNALGLTEENKGKLRDIVERDITRKLRNVI